ncbi:MAG: MBL fold metallo-hydrolase [Verrucomicrobiales bacterium]
MAVNAYLAWDAGTKKAAAFDTGAKAKEMVEFAKKQGLSIEAIFLTHTHPDHIADLGALRKAAAEGAKVNVHVLEQLPDCDFLQDGAEYEVGALKIVAKHTHGHSRGGTSYIIEGLKRPVAVVGDALFAGSMGGGMASYRDALRTNRQHLLSLPDDAVLCPGHGPMTTVAEEKAHNPFFPEFS